MMISLLVCSDLFIPLKYGTPLNQEPKPRDGKVILVATKLTAEQKGKLKNLLGVLLQDIC